MNISEPFVRRPIATSLLMAALALVGIVAFPLLPVAPLPQVDFPTIQVSAQLPGAGPDTMASTVAAPLERRLGEIAGIEQITSTSSLGNTSIQLQFAIGRDIDRGFLVGVSIRRVEGAVHLFNPGSDDSYFVATIGVTF